VLCAEYFMPILVPLA